MTQPLLSVAGVTKRFPGVLALNDVTFDLRPGEVHALVGENGAGKSTLIKVLTGAYRADAGTVSFEGRPITFRHPREAQALGIAVIYQEFNLLPDRTVAENIYLGREPTRWGLLSRRQMERDTASVLAELGVDDIITPRAPVRSLTVAQQQLVEIAKAVSFQPRVLVMDEPTSALTEREADLLFGLVRRLQSRGLAVVYISHRLPEVFDLATRISVLKDGQLVGTLDPAKTSKDAVVQMMVGREIEHYYPAKAAAQEIGQTILSVRDGGNGRIHDIGLSVRAGEIVGIAGLQGSGRYALARALFGVDPLTRGSTEFLGRPLRITGPRQALDAGIAFLTEDRKRDGLTLMQPVADNCLLTVRALRPILAALRPARDADRLSGLWRQVDIRAAGPQVEVGSLSGGNQQKVVLARLLARKPRLLICAEPTRGIDVSAKAAIHGLLRDIARAGAGVLMVSSELPEVIGSSDRILVMRGGTIAGELPAGSSEAAVMQLATGTAAAA